MADKDEKKAPQEVPEDKLDQSEPKDTKEAWRDVAGDKFKSEEELAKAYKELESKLGKQGDEVSQAREFAAAVQPILEEIRNDPELFDALDKKLRSKDQPADNSKADAKGNEKVEDQEVRSVTSDIVLAKFEETHGIDKLPSDKRKEMRQAIGDAVFDITEKPITKVDLRRLGKVLENAYILANKDTLIEKSKLEALASARELDEAGIPSMPSSGGKGEATLTSEEAKVAEKMGLTREQYLEGKKS